METRFTGSFTQQDPIPEEGTNGFTLAPVPGAIASLGAEPVFVEVTDALTIDLDDLKAKIDSSGAKYLLLSHMRGHLVDMDALMHDGGQLARHGLGAARRRGVLFVPDL